MQKLGFKILFCIFLLFFCIFSSKTFGEEDYFPIAKEAFRRGCYEVSLDYLEKFSKTNSSHLEAQFLIAECYFHQAKYNQALEKFQEILEIPQSQQVRDALFYWMAECYLKESLTDKAKECYFKIIRDFPDSQHSIFSLYSLGWILFSEGNFKEALDIFQKFLKKFPQERLTRDIRLKVIECLYNLKDYSELKESIDSYLAEFGEPIEKYLLFLYRAEALFYLGNYSEAVSDYEKVLNSSNDRKLKELARLGIGFVYLKLNQDQAAYKEFKELIEECEDRDLLLQAYLGMTEALCNMDMYLEAKETYYQIKEIFQNGDLDRVHYGLGLCLLKEKKFGEAKEEFSKVSSESSIHLIAAYLKGICLYNLNEYREAVLILQNILTNMDPNENEELIPEIEFYISDCFFRMGKINEALSRFKNLRTKYPNSQIIQDVLYWLADYYYRERNFDLAERYLNTLISNHPESQITTFAYYMLGRIYLERRDYLRAKDLLLRAKEQNKDLEISILPEIASVYKNLREFELAISSFRRAIELSSSIEEISRWQFQVAEIFEEQKRFNEAISEYQKVSKDSSYGVKALLRVAKIYENRESWTEAEDIYRKILDLDVGEARFAEERLEEITTVKIQNNYKDIRY